MLRLGRLPKSDNSVTSRSSNRLSPKSAKPASSSAQGAIMVVTPLTETALMTSANCNNRLSSPVCQDRLQLMGYNEGEIPGSARVKYVGACATLSTPPHFVPRHPHGRRPRGG